MIARVGPRIGEMPASEIEIAESCCLLRGDVIRHPRIIYSALR